MTNRHTKMGRLIAVLGALAAIVLAVGWYTDNLAGAVTAIAYGATLTVFGMVMDSRLEFCDATSIAASAGTALVGNAIDLTSIGRNLMGQLWLVITVDTEIITGGSAGTVEFILASDAQAAIAVDGSETQHFVSRPFVSDDANANDALFSAGKTPVCIPLPGEGPTYERYLGLLVRTTTTTTTAGKINAFLTNDPSQWKALDNGIAGI